MEAMRAAGMTAAEVIVAATHNGARAMRRESDFGTVERGKAADFVILPADPLADIRNLRRVERVVRGGDVWRRDQLEFPKAEGIGQDGRAWFSLPDTSGAIARADSALSTSPNDVEKTLAAAAARAAVWRYCEAIELYTRAVELAPNDWRPYRFRGHRYISLRRLDEAVRDLERAAALDSLSFDVAYHLGLAYYLRGDYARAAEVYGRCMGLAEKPDAIQLERSGRLPQGFRSCMRMASNDDDRVAMADWRYRALRRAGRDDDARRLLDTIRGDMNVGVNTSYLQALLFYKGVRTEGEILDPRRITGNQLETIGYGVANFHLAQGDTARALSLMRRIASDDSRWQAFGFIAAETDLQRLSERPR
jgi:tetratricopeptide (TPR) repeat protein